VLVLENRRSRQGALIQSRGGKDDSTRSGTPETNIFGTWDLEFEKLVFVRYIKIR
jgi:hypothetical protein